MPPPVYHYEPSVAVIAALFVSAVWNGTSRFIPGMSIESFASNKPEFKYR